MQGLLGLSIPKQAFFTSDWREPMHVLPHDTAILVERRSYIKSL